jgi:hypothetical protein
MAHYGQFGWHNQTIVRAHAFAWDMLVGIPRGSKVLDHECHNLAALNGECDGGKCRHRRCVNPAHVTLKTRGENSFASPLSPVSVNSARMTCAKGHPYVAGSFEMYHNTRRCLVCWNDYTKSRACCLACKGEYVMSYIKVHQRSKHG